MKSLCPEWGQTLLGIDRISLDVEQDISEVLLPLLDVLGVPI